MSFVGSIFKLLLALVMVVAVAIVAVFVFTRVAGLIKPPEPAATARQPVIFTILPGESVGTVADHLQSAGLIDSALLFRLRLKLTGNESSFKAGRFQVTPGTGMDQIITLLSTPPAEIGVRFTVIEGTRIEEEADKLQAAGIVSATHFIQLANTAQGAAQFQDPFVAASGKPADKGLEGFLFPDTYDIKQGGADNSEAAIAIMLKTMGEKFTPDMVSAAAAKHRSVYQVLTVASITQREGVVKDELPLIAAVFWNRLDQGMLLGADPTTQFALGKPGDWWPQLNLDPNTVNNPYNTYKVQGLPPGPICNPGLDAIQAAVSPAQTNYLYFVAKNDGSGRHAFATTLQEHEQNRVIYGNKTP
ncbi:MAG TPA: endolytic transglycosylase MltG [Chloroflexota bacterium]